MHGCDAEATNAVPTSHHWPNAVVAGELPFASIISPGYLEEQTFLVLRPLHLQQVAPASLEKENTLAVRRAVVRMK